MSMPTPATNTTPSAALAGPPSVDTPSVEPIAIQDLESGKLDVDSLVLEIQDLRSHIAGLRYEMAKYIRLLASVNEDSTSSGFYHEVAAQIGVLKNSLDTYNNAYRRLLPVIRYSKLKKGLSPEDQTKVVSHEVKVDTKFLSEQAANKMDISKNPLVAASEMGAPYSAGSVGSPGARNGAAKRPMKAKPPVKKK
ncbi:hypothetical protein OGAPHI_001032 [Ogataea philodendri]|uniref:Uncharacterized protein n=1 Tax=Ogataea philodendri TaxID=1378263 RepID=A0A9P8PEH1_9ASCO|nr:uncharacterized protein OGAPHI_001032 [Ogataea philodendri]KAH3670517.1 hypothetical protein OGAPHI_001032 [Ogataea philodendri]